MENQVSSKFHTPVDYLKLFFRRKWLVVVPAYIGLIAGIIACFLLPKAWQSSTIILIEEPKIINPLIQDLAVSTTAIQRMQSIREILLGWNSLVELANKLNLTKNAHNQLEFERLIMGLRKSITVAMSDPGRTGVPTASLIRIAYSTKNPQEAQLVCQTLTDILMEKNMESQTKETGVAIKFIQEQLGIYKRKAKESEIAVLQDDLKTLLQDSTEEHPMVKDLRQKIEVAQKELDSGNYEIKNPDQPASEATKQALQQELDKIIQQETQADTTGAAPESQTDPNTAIYKLMLIDKVDQATAKDTNVNNAIYTMLLQKLETAKMTQRLEASREGTRYTIIDPPRLPLLPTKPNKPMVIFIGFLLGAASGVGVAFAREFLDQSILDIEDAKHSMDLPVLGAISRITTQDEVERETHKRKTAITVSAAIGIVLIITAGLISLLKH